MLDDWFQNVAVKFHYSNKPETWFVYGLEVGVNGFDAVGPADPSARISGVAAGRRYRSAAQGRGSGRFCRRAELRIPIPEDIECVKCFV